jgi:large subunit ribosomal protein L13
MRYEQKTYRPKESEIKQRWYEIDAEGKVLGRMSTKIATILMGKDRPDFTTNLDTGAFVIVVNAEKIVLTGDKINKKIYRTFSQYPGHMKEVKAKDVLAKKPEKIVKLAVKRMLPKTRMGKAYFEKLKVYAGPDHPHQAQKPEKIDV